MKTVKLTIEEKLTYRREFEVEVPDEMDKTEIERILNKAEREEYLSDFMYVLNANSMEASKGFDEDLSSPWSSEIECEEYEIIDEEVAQL